LRYHPGVASEPQPIPRVLKASKEGQPVIGETSLPERTTIVIGRGVGCDVVLKDVKASREHCKLTRKDGGYILEDLGSKNGTFVGDVRIKAPVPLKPNQSFKVGDTVLYLS